MEHFERGRADLFASGTNEGRVFSNLMVELVSPLKWVATVCVVVGLRIICAPFPLTQLKMKIQHDLLSMFFKFPFAIFI